MARRRFSSQHGSYWWPQKAPDGCEDADVGDIRGKNNHIENNYIGHDERALDASGPQSYAKFGVIRRSARQASFATEKSQVQEHDDPHIPAEQSETAPISAESSSGPKYLAQLDIVPNSTSQTSFATKESQGEGCADVHIPAKQPETSSRVHILGTGKVGKFIAHELAGIGGRPPITLLIHRQLVIQQWYEEGQVLELMRNGQREVQIGFDVESANLTEAEHAQGRMFSTKTVLSRGSGWIIDKLVVTTPAQITAQALFPIRDRLKSTSTILFLHNAMGVIEEVNRKVFTNPDTRPHYMEGYTTHGLRNHPSKTFTTAQYRRGRIYLSSLHERGLSPTSADLPDSTRSLLRMFTRSVSLNAKGISSDQFMALKLEQLAVDAVIGPLTVVFDCKVSDLLSNFMVTQLLRDILREISLVVCAMPELQHVPRLQQRFEPAQLERIVFHIAMKGSDMISDMHEQVRKGERSEVGYINGFIVKRAAKLRIDCPVNMTILRMVKAKTSMKSRERNSYIPFEDAKDF